MTTQCQAFKTSRRIHAEAMLLYIIVCQYGCSEGVAETATVSTIAVKVGESIMFPFAAEGNQSYSVSLFLKTFTIAEEHFPKMATFVREQHKGRVSIGNDSIWLKNLSLSDSGLYQVKIEYTSGGFKPQKYTDFHLQVFVRWVPALCATSAFLAFGVLILLYKRKQHQQYKSETIQVEVDEPVMEEEPPSAVPSIDPVYVSMLSSSYLRGN